MRLDHLLSKEFCFGTARRTVKRIRFLAWPCLLAKRDGAKRAWHAVGVLEQRSGPDPTDTSDCLVVIGLFGVGVLVVNCIVDASIFDLCKQY